MERKIKKWLIIIFILTIIIRLVLAFSTPNFTYESYFHLRHIEHITETGLPDYNDNLSYGGRHLVFLPFFHYFIALFNLILPLELIAKIIPNILIATLTLIIFTISKKITKNDHGSLLSAFIAGFLPILYQTNSLTPQSLFLPLLFITIYSFMNIKNKSYLYLYILTFLITSLTSPATFLVIVGFGIYLILSKVENKKINKTELELIIFSTFFYLWIQFIFFKDVFLTEGVSFIWQNIPSQIILQYLPKLSLIESIIMVSFFPFLAGIFVVYRSLFELKKQKTFLLISFVISTTLLAWLRLIEFNLSLSFFGLILAILFASFYKEVLIYLKKTKIIFVEKYILIIIVILLLFSMFLPAITNSLEQNVPTIEEVQLFKSLDKIIPENVGVVALLEEGNLITYYSKRRNLMDDQFNLIKDVDKRFSNLESLFTTKFQTQAVSLLNEYNSEYLVLSSRAKKKYKTDTLSYTKGECFKIIYDNESIVYQSKCVITSE